MKHSFVMDVEWYGKMKYAILFFVFLISCSEFDHTKTTKYDNFTLEKHKSCTIWANCYNLSMSACEADVRKHCNNAHILSIEEHEEHGGLITISADCLE